MRGILSPQLRVLILLLCSTIFTNISAQTDTEFWFVAPEVTSGHRDSPVVLRISAFSEATDIEISMPANPAFSPIQQTIAANSSQTIDLTAFKETLENKPANTVLNKGLYIKSSKTITAYYEVVGANLNPDIFPLKGNNAKGKEFFTPFQTYYSNGNYNPTPLSGFDIVATKDSTTVTIVPTKALNGHPAGESFSIILNRGQTWSGVAAGTAASQHPAGTHITSDKPICITIKDDSMQNSGCRDLMGDQMVPIEHAGTEYIVMKGYLNDPDRAFVLAIEDNTEVFVDGSTIPAGTINWAEQLMINISNPTTYIRTNKPVYVLQITGFGCEMGGSLLPSIRCTGSSTIFFTRSTNESFGLNIMVKKGSETHFLLNGNNAPVSADKFNLVPGTNNEWMYAQIQFGDQDVPVNEASVLTNTSTTQALFHMGVINGAPTGGCRYGYFSDYNAGVNFGGNKVVCLGDSLELNAGLGKDSYLWSTGDTLPVINVHNEGTYWVTTSRDGCIFTDTVTVIEQEVLVNLGTDTTFCGNGELLLHAGEGYKSYRWQDGSTSPEFRVSTSGIYSVSVQSIEGCKGLDSIRVSFAEIPPAPVLSGSSPICANDTLHLMVGNTQGMVTVGGPAGFSGHAGENILTGITADRAGDYYAYNTAEGCRSDSARFTLIVNPQPLPVITGDSLHCTGELSTLNAGTEFASYLWSDGSQNQSLKAGTGTWKVIVTNSNGCKGSDTFTVKETDIRVFFSKHPYAASVPLGRLIIFSDSSSYTEGFPPVSFHWNFGDGTSSTDPEISHKYSKTGKYIVKYIATNSIGCSDTFSIELNVFGEIIIPNAFSPNGDGKNDYFVIQYLEAYPNSILTIYNRWGKKVYQDDNYQNNWDGDGLPDGTYFYILELPESKNNYKGTVNIFNE